MQRMFGLTGKTAAWLLASISVNVLLQPDIAAADVGNAEPLDLRQDWMSSVPRNTSSAPVRPPDGAEVIQTPPDFSWPDLGAEFEYRLTLVYPDGTERNLPAPQNWINWDEILPAGEYSWHVQATASNSSERSRVRRFTVASCAVPFLVPGTDELLRRAVDRPRPRALPDPAALAAMLDRRHDGLVRLMKQADELASADLPSDPAEGRDGDIESAALGEVDRTVTALFAFVASGETHYYRPALRRALNLATWNPRGATSYAAADQAARGIAAALTLAYDWLYPRLEESQKRQLLAALRVRVADLYDDLVGRHARIAVHPYDSHGNHTLAFIAAMSVVLAGDLPPAGEWLRGALPLALNWSSPWGGEDGGFANGTAYAQWVIGDTLIAWNMLRWTVGVDVGRKAWLRNHPHFLAYFLPPGAPAGAFGDGAERSLLEQRARFGRAAALFSPSPLARWYAAELSGADPSRLHALLAPLPGSEPAPFPQGVPNAAHFPSIGWTAMHSNLADRERTSVYFKSSFYGSFNHSHADQNSFVVNAGGQSLAIDSGYYDGYATPHWRNWYKQTKAHNAITFDGGRGQTVFEESGEVGAGAITRFEHHAAYDLVTGDATAAYGGALDLALRSMVYLRPDALVVYDHLVSSAARRWEWNIHATGRMKERGEKRIEIRAGNARLCVEMLGGPEMTFMQSDRFDTAPRHGDMPAQWHGAFVASEPSASADFVALLSVGCLEPNSAVSRSGSRWHLAISGRQITLERGHAHMEPRQENARGDRLASHAGITCPED